MSGRPPVAVLLRAIGLGDMLTGLPATAMLRRALPGHRLVGAVPQRFAGPLLAAGLLDEVVPTSDLDAVAGLPRRPEIAVDLHGNGPASRRPLLALAPGRLLAFVRPGQVVDSGGAAPADPGSELLISRWDSAEHEVARWCRLVTEHLPGAGPAPSVRGLLPEPEPLWPGSTVLHPGAASGARRWPASRWRQVAGELAAAGHAVVVTGTPQEAALVHEVAGSHPVRTATSLRVEQLFGLVASARLLLSGDTGLAHVASAFGTPSVVLFGPVPPAAWGPPPDARHRVLWPAPDPAYRGDPHGQLPDPVLTAIAVPDVLEQVPAALADTARHPEPAG